MIDEKENQDPDPLSEDEVKELEKRERKAEKERRAAAKNAKRSSEESRAALRRKVKIFYDLQKLRIQAAGRGKPKGKKNPVQLLGADVAVLDQRSKELRSLEARALNDIRDHLATEKLWTDIISADRDRFKGFAETMTAVLIAEVDITACSTVSKLWAYAGLAPVPAMRCKACRDEVVEDDTNASFKHRYNRQNKCAVKHPGPSDVYESSAAMKPTKGQKLPFNRWLKTKMVGVAATNLLRSGSPYRKFYDDYKHRITCAGRGVSDGHRHRMALRYMIKMFLLDVWREWRAAEGLDVRAPYQEEYLGHKHAS